MKHALLVLLLAAPVHAADPLVDFTWGGGKSPVVTAHVRVDPAGKVDVRRVRLRFAAGAVARTQEFVLRWVDAGAERREVVRQQWNFAAGGSAEVVEDYRVDLPGVVELELVVTPDISGGDAVASLAELRVA
jgi:hypothetical protein